MPRFAETVLAFSIPVRSEQDMSLSVEKKSELVQAYGREQESLDQFRRGSERSLEVVDRAA